MKLKVLFVTQEITPYLPETEMSLIGRHLPQGIQERDREIRTFLPRFGNINERRNQLHEVIRLSGMNLVIDDTDHPLVIKVASIQPARMQVYFIDNEDFFSRKHALTDKEGKEFEDNDERAIFYSRGVIETVKKLGWAPDIIHCHGWFTSLVPYYMKKIYGEDPLFENNFKIVYSVYDDAFKNPLDKGLANKLIEDKVSADEVETIKNPDWDNITKFAIKYADGVIMGSDKLKDNMKDFIAQSGKPFLDAQSEETYIDKYNEFYDKLIST